MCYCYNTIPYRRTVKPYMAETKTPAIARPCHTWTLGPFVFPCYFPSGSSSFPSPGYSQTFLPSGGYVICGRDCRYACRARQETQQNFNRHSRLRTCCGPFYLLMLTLNYWLILVVSLYCCSYCSYCSYSIVATIPTDCHVLDSRWLRSMQV